MITESVAHQGQRPPREPGRWAVWVWNPLRDAWTHEFSDSSRAEALRYMACATDEQSCRMWDFILVRPA